MSETNNITKELLNSIFTYKDGAIFWKESRKGTQAGDPAGGINGNGYFATQINGKRYKNHVIIYIMHYGNTKYEIDHIDKNPLNNNIENLREATKSQNQWNKSKSSNNSSGFKNVWLDKKVNKWAVSVQKYGKSYWGGYFDELSQANIAAIKLRQDLHEVFARN